MSSTTTPSSDPLALTLAVLGATGAAGDQLLSSLHGSPLVTGPVLAFASNRRSPRVDTASWGPDSLPVYPMTSLPEKQVDLAFSCLPAEIAARVLPQLVARGVFVIDVGNATAGVLNVPLVHPGVMTGLPEGALEAGADDFIGKPFDSSELRARVSVGHRTFRLELAMAQQIIDLNQALTRVKQLEGIIPICSYCKKIKDEHEDWQRLETFISQHSEALFSHGMCPECYKEQMKIIENFDYTNIKG